MKVVINWLKLLTASQKITTFPVSKARLPDFLHWVMITRTSLGEGLTLYLGFMGDLYPLEIWGGSTTNLTYHGLKQLC